ncbi:hypothetical protein OKW50_004837 [Paraburkholderia youngii]
MARFAAIMAVIRMEQFTFAHAPRLHRPRLNH